MRAARSMNCITIGNVPSGKWTTAIMTVSTEANGQAKVRTWINKGGDSAPRSVTFVPVSALPQVFLFGGQKNPPNKAATNNFKGQIDEFIYLPRLLNDGEVETLLKLSKE